jgi:hypothetical protein
MQSDMCVRVLGSRRQPAEAPSTIIIATTQQDINIPNIPNIPSGGDVDIR